MKRNQLILALASLILSLSIVLQKSASAAERLLPRISFEKTVCDLGDVGQGTKNSCGFRFTNTGRGLLKIGNIRRTCGCTVFKLNKKEYAPNETGTIKVIYTAGRSTGTKNLRKSAFNLSLCRSLSAVALAKADVSAVFFLFFCLHLFRNL